MTWRVDIAMEVPEILDTEVGDLKANAVKKAFVFGGMKAWGWFLRVRLPRRFKDAGLMEMELGWAERNAKYERFKARFKRVVNQDHVFTGETSGQVRNQTARGGESGGVSVTSKRWKAVLKLGPQYGRRKPGGIDLATELKQISPREAEQMATMFGRETVDYLNHDPRARRKTRKKLR